MACTSIDNRVKFLSAMISYQSICIIVIIIIINWNFVEVFWKKRQISQSFHNSSMKWLICAIEVYGNNIERFYNLQWKWFRNEKFVSGNIDSLWSHIWCVTDVSNELIMLRGDWRITIQTCANHLTYDELTFPINLDVSYVPKLYDSLQ